MRHGRILLGMPIGLCLWLASGMVWAASTPAPAGVETWLTPEQMHATGLDTLTPEQLALLNELLQARKERVAPAATETPDAAATSRALVGFDDAPVNSHSAVALPGWEPGTVFALDNGQQWQVLKGRMANHPVKPGQAISIDQGLGGRWFLRVDEDTPAARVIRIR